MELLERRQFEDFNTNVIAALAGVSTGSLYQYYPDKEAVLRALVVREVQGRAARAVDAIMKHPGPGAVAAAVGAALAHAQERPALTTQLAFAEPLVLVAARDSSLVGELIPAMERAIQKDYGVSAGDASSLAHDLLGICKGMLLSAAARNAVGATDLSRKITLAVDSYLAASTT